MAGFFDDLGIVLAPSDPEEAEALTGAWGGDMNIAQVQAYGQQQSDWSAMIQGILGTAAKTGMDVWRNKTMVQAGLDPLTGKPFPLGEVVDRSPTVAQQVKAINPMLLVAGVVGVGVLVWALK